MVYLLILVSSLGVVGDVAAYETVHDCLHVAHALNADMTNGAYVYCEGAE